MGYSTIFYGNVSLNKPLDDETYDYLVKFNETRRIKRNLPPEYGVEGEFYVDGKGLAGQDREDNIIDYNEDNIIDYNSPPSTQPGLWCQWIPTKNRMGIEWDGGEKFYCSDEWMIYLLDNILAPKGYVANGTIEAQGDDINDHYWIKVTNNKVTVENLDLIKQKAEAFDILQAKKEDLPLYVGQKLSKLAKEILQKRLDGKINVIES